MAELRPYLERVGPQPAGRLRAALGLRPATFQRAIGAHGGLLVVGKARATTYAARREIAEVKSPIEVFEVDPDGGHRLALRLHPVAPFGHYVESACADVESGFHETDPSKPGPGLDLPWFLADLQPAGFLGRALALQYAFKLPADPLRWQGDDVLRYATSYGVDLPGAFVVGRFALDFRHYAAPSSVDRADFPAIAFAALAGDRRGSSAGGDQPKFLLVTPSGGSIVKFSPPVDTPAGERWADLLLAEHVIHRVLREVEFEAPVSEMHDVGGRRFLEIPRFDRHGPSGRSGVVSLLPLDRDGVGSDLRRWSLVTAGLVEDSRLSMTDHVRVRWLEAFGHQLANTDMHLGNLSLRLRGTRILGLAPVYDMLPMFYAPGFGGELRPGRFRPYEDEPPAGARAAAGLAWARISEDDRVSIGFRAIAAGHAEALARCG